MSHLQILYGRKLPHIVRWDKPLFVTFSTTGRRILSPPARTIALRHSLFSHGTRFGASVVVVMPDHVHMLLTLAPAESLDLVMKAIKGTSSRVINRITGTSGSVWQDESFDHVVRRSEGWSRTADYIVNNPVRGGLVRSAEEYPWLWRAWIEGGDRGWLAAAR
jgi:REP element-mobilizing transposase RayT